MSRLVAWAVLLFSIFVWVCALISGDRVSIISTTLWLGAWVWLNFWDQLSKPRG